MKTCVDCGAQVKPHRKRCGHCAYVFNSDYQLNYRTEHRDENKAKCQQYRHDNLKRLQAYDRKRGPDRRRSQWDERFGWAAGTCQALLESKQVCDLCGFPFGTKRLMRKVVEHDHETNEFRGIVHNKCNLVLAHAEDSPVILQFAIQYLNRWKTSLKEK